MIVWINKDTRADMDRSKISLAKLQSRFDCVVVFSSKCKELISISDL